MTRLVNSICGPIPEMTTEQKIAALTSELRDIDDRRAEIIKAIERLRDLATYTA